jgi:hypothetical protein
MIGRPRRGDDKTMWSPPLTIRPVLLIVGPPYSAYIVSGDTIFEQGLVAAPTATVRPAHVHPAFVVTQPGGHGTTPNHILVRRKPMVPRI